LGQQISGDLLSKINRKDRLKKYELGRFGVNSLKFKVQEFVKVGWYEII